MTPTKNGKNSGKAAAKSVSRDAPAPKVETEITPAPKPSQKEKRNHNQQQAFIEFYLVCWNGAEAARRAGYAEASANVQAAQLLAIPSIQQEISNRITELTATADEVLLRLASHSRGSMEDFLSPGGNIDLEIARAAGKLHLIKKFKVTTITREDSDTHIQEIELYDAQAATVQLAKLIGLYVDRMKVSFDVSNYSDAELSAEFEKLIKPRAAIEGASNIGGATAPPDASHPASGAGLDAPARPAD